MTTTNHTIGEDAANVAIGEREAAWKIAIDNELATIESTADSFGSAREAINALINWHVSVALDPAVSKEAQSLIDRGAALTAEKVAGQEAVEHIASVYEDKDGTKYVQFDVEDAEDIPVGTKLYPGARTLTRREIEEIAGYVEGECKACSGMTTLYIAAEAAVEETLRRIASPVPAQSGEQDERALTDRLIDAIEGECDGLAITGEQAASILAYLQYGRALDSVETLLRDAMRYRKLRDADINAIHKGGVFAGLTPDNVVINGEDLDIAVDLLIDDAAQPASSLADGGERE